MSFEAIVDDKGRTSNDHIIAYLEPMAQVS